MRSTSSRPALLPFRFRAWFFRSVAASLALFALQSLTAVAGGMDGGTAASPISDAASSGPTVKDGASSPKAVKGNLQKAIDGSQRTPAYVKRDRYRHPFQTLEFFGMRPDMTVVEVLPGGGWYTEILAPFLHDRGHLIEATPSISSSNPFSRRRAIRYKAKLRANPAVYGHVTMQAFEPPSYMPLGAPDSVDMIVTFRNIHDFIYANVHGEVSEVIARRFFRSAYRTLKPGGVLGIVAHRAPANMQVAKSFKLGRLPQDYVVSLAEQAGFRLAGTSEINANPKDPGTVSVWHLPPALSHDQKDSARYEAIGEADNMTLRFEKPRP